MRRPWLSRCAPWHPATTRVMAGYHPRSSARLHRRPSRARRCNPLLSGPTRAPFTRVSLGVSARHDHDGTTHDPIEEGVRELWQKDPACISVHHGVGLWVGFQGCDSDIDGMTECITEAWALNLIPPKGILDIGLGGRCEDRRLHLERRPSRTSDQGRPNGRPARTSSSSASNRRSSSSRCCRESGTFAGCWLKRSQSSPSSSSCSSGDRSSRFSAG